MTNEEKARKICGCENAITKSNLYILNNQSKQQLYDIIIALWDLLDKIDTFADLKIDDTNPNNPFREIERMTQERHKFVKSDGYNLYIGGEQITDLNTKEE